MQQHSTGMRTLEVHLNKSGFTLIEIMIAVAIIGILAATAALNFTAYRNKTRVAASITTVESIQTSLAGYAAESPGSLYPLSIASWEELIAITNKHGATLKPTGAQQGLILHRYETWDIDANNVAGDDYFMIFYTLNVPRNLPGSAIEVRSSGILKQTW